MRRASKQAWQRGTGAPPLAAEHGTTVRALVEDLAQGTRTRVEYVEYVEYVERAAPARAELASALGAERPGLLSHIKGCA
ncbi:hypothetical protein ABZX30_13445 [Streptomyces sp. NPDC004542]|uniref:hypothetical protein n=1 Tax=Streptomyces sp. NPDC004542 TaxID=3154281 RepID=UPI0033B765D1